jgi:hypothetical protein
LIFCCWNFQQLWKQQEILSFLTRFFYFEIFLEIILSLTFCKLEAKHDYNGSTNWKRYFVNVFWNSTLHWLQGLCILFSLKSHQICWIIMDSLILLFWIWRNFFCQGTHK